MKATNFRSKVMKQAWQIFRSTGIMWKNCVKKAWELYHLRKRMLKGEVKFWYYKLDGSIRMAFGTLTGINQNSKGKKAHNETTMCYYDTESKGFRSFRIENFIISERVKSA